jgi:hypothetical protein
MRETPDSHPESIEGVLVCDSEARKLAREMISSSRKVAAH